MSVKPNQAIYQLNVALQGSHPLIWRRIQVSSEFTLPKVHRTLQIVMGWENYHLHEFRVNGKAYGEPDPDDPHFDNEVADERRVRLATLVSAVGASFEYIYDFGDTWQHDILLEATLPVIPRKRYPVCLGGARSAPPEDVGGIEGYERYLEALGDLKHPDHREMLGWRGRFDPEYFPISSVNRMLREEFPSKPARTQKAKAKPAIGSFENDLNAIFSAVIHTGRLPRQERTLIKPDEQVPIPLSARDRELIFDSFAEPDLTDRLCLQPETGKSRIFYFTLDELDDLIGCVAAEANHAGKKEKKEWDVLYDRLVAVLDNYKES